MKYIHNNNIKYNNKYYNTMVKNNTGGNKAKGYARKDYGSNVNKNKLRLAVEEGEYYAIVTKMLGNGMCNVTCCDNIQRLCIIRGKFKGKGMHNNLISPGTWVLIGIRTWESTDKKDAMPKSDLLEVYSSVDKERLKTSVSTDLSMLTLNDGTTPAHQAENLVKFINEKEEEYIKTMEKSILDGSKKIEFSTKADDEEINIDDI